MLNASASTWLAPALAAGALLCAAPAVAQDSSGRDASNKEAARMTIQFAECTVKQGNSRNRLARLLTMSPGDPAYRDLGASFLQNDCVPPASDTVRMSFDPLMFRYSLFEARYRVAYRRAAPPSVADLPPVDVEGEFTAPVVDLPPVVRFLRELSDCVIRQKPAEAHALVLSLPFSKEETAALESVKPALAACMSEGQTLTFSRQMLRGSLAEALYKAATRPQTPAQTQSVN